MTCYVCPEHRSETVNHRGKGCLRCANREFDRPAKDHGSGWGALLDVYEETAWQRWERDR